MLRRVPRLPLRLGLLLVLLSAAVAAAQTPSEGMDAIDAQYRKHRLVLGQLLKGALEADPKDKDHAEAVDALAKYATLRFLNDLDQKAPGKMDALYQDFDRNVGAMLRNKERSRSLGQMYTAQIIVHAKRVLSEGRPIAQVNVARVLARLADLEQGELADALVEVVNDPKLNDAVHLYALRGLRKLLAIPPRTPPDPPVVSKAQEDKAVAAILAFLAEPPAFPPSAPRGRVDGYRVVRREAIRALAQAHHPVVGTGRPALVLLRFAGHDTSVAPEPRLDERLEAAIGVARMQVAAAKDYQADYAAYVLGRFVVEFVTAANMNAGANKAAERERPWKIDAARLGEALEAMRAGTKDKYVTEALNRALPLLAGVEGGKQPDPNPLTTWLNGNEPPHKELFKDVPDSAIKAPAGE